MLFKLTFLLVAGLFAVMYFAPDLPEDHRSNQVAQAADPEPRTSQPAPPRAAEAPTPEPTRPQEPSEPGPAPQELASAAPEPAPDQQGESLGFAETPETSETRERPAPLVIEGLSGGDAASALSLSDRIRARVEAERTAQAAEAEQAATSAARNSIQNATRDTPATTARTAPQTSGPGETRAEVIATAVNLRGGPSTANAVVGQVDFGDEVVLLGEVSPGWSRIRHPETGADAFMASRFLQPLGN